MVAMLSPLLNPATPERRAAHFLCKANRLRASRKFRRCKTSFDQNTQRTAVLKTFLNLLNKTGKRPPWLKRSLICLGEWGSKTKIVGGALGTGLPKFGGMGKIFSVIE